MQRFATQSRLTAYFFCAILPIRYILKAVMKRVVLERLYREASGCEGVHHAEREWAENRMNMASEQRTERMIIS